MSSSAKASKSAAGFKNEDYMDGYQDEFFDGDLDRDYAIKKKNAISSPKSAHNPLKTKDVLLEYYQDSDDEDKEDFG